MSKKEWKSLYRFFRYQSKRTSVQDAFNRIQYADSEEYYIICRIIYGAEEYEII